MYVDIVVLSKPWLSTRVNLINSGGIRPVQSRTKPERTDVQSPERSLDISSCIKFLPGKVKLHSFVVYGVKSDRVS